MNIVKGQINSLIVSPAQSRVFLIHLSSGAAVRVLDASELDTGRASLSRGWGGCTPPGQAPTRSLQDELAGPEPLAPCPSLAPGSWTSSLRNHKATHVRPPGPWGFVTAAAPTSNALPQRHRHIPRLILPFYLHDYP